jgi:hypothetical protein
MDESQPQRPPSARAPLPLTIGFALFVAALGYMIVASLAQREAPVFTPSASSRVRAAGWRERGDTLTIDATDGDRWRYASLAIGRTLDGADTTRWDIAARRYRLTVDGALADLGRVSFDSARVSPATRFVASRPGEVENEAIRRWYGYSMTTHLLTPGSRVYALRTRDGTLWKLQLLGYYCPRLTAGCVTLRYAPIQ